MHEKMSLVDQSDNLVAANHNEIIRYSIPAHEAYCGSFEKVKTLSTKKQVSRNPLSHEEVSENRKISSRRIIVQNYFARFSNYWNVLRCQYRRSDNVYA